MGRDSLLWAVVESKKHHCSSHSWIMEGQSAKRRRVYSVEPNKIVQSLFSRNYLNYLVPALLKIKENASVEHNSHCEINNAVKYEVDMAMVLSMSDQGFAWSNGLKVKLQSDHVNAGKSTNFIENEASSEGSSRIFHDRNETVIPPDLSTKSEEEILRSKCECKDMSERKRDLAREDDEDEDGGINSQLKRLRRLMPGGTEMCDEKMVQELQSYISCLQMQVNALQCLLAETR
ncbi:hypothetical protein RJT34_32860 [Clitoria ternatea]|uniref:IBH1-like N-terminal domain-containing protein n=1 Tax=Clitoria ternatea TaxID=43366 RepID=A0AAN9EZA0_CLITE